MNEADLLARVRVVLGEYRQSLHRRENGDVAANHAMLALVRLLGTDPPVEQSLSTEDVMKAFYVGYLKRLLASVERDDIVVLGWTQSPLLDFQKQYVDEHGTNMIGVVHACCRNMSIHYVDRQAHALMEKAGK